MLDAMNLLMLVCAALAALAFGVLSAYVLCRAGFGLLKVHAQSVAQHTAAEAKAATA